MPSYPKPNKKTIIIALVLIVVGGIGLYFPFLPLSFVGDFAYLNEVAAQHIAQTTATNSLAFEEVYLPTVQDRLKIESIGVDMPLIVDDNVRALNKGGWLFPNTSTPDQGGNTVIIGHRYKWLPPKSHTFFDLDKLEKGDTYIVDWQGTRYTYAVSESRIVEPTELSVLDPTDNSQTTLITCAPAFSNKYRLIIVADLVDEKPINSLQ